MKRKRYPEDESSEYEGAQKKRKVFEPEPPRHSPPREQDVKVLPLDHQVSLPPPPVPAKFEEDRHWKEMRSHWREQKEMRHRKMKLDTIMEKRIEKRESVPLHDVGRKIFPPSPPRPSHPDEKFVYPEMMKVIEEENARIELEKEKEKRRKEEERRLRREQRKLEGKEVDDDDENIKEGPDSVSQTEEVSLVNPILVEHFLRREREEKAKLKNRRGIVTIQDDKRKRLEKLGYVMSGNRRKYDIQPVYDRETYYLKTYIEKKKKEEKVRNNFKKLIEMQRKK